MIRNKSVVSEARQIDLAIDLVTLGARLQVLEVETKLSRERLLRLYKEVKGVSPPKGMLPYSTDWFMSWQPNIHSSLFVDTYHYLTQHAGIKGIEAIIKAYRLYLEHVKVNQMESVLSLTRAWSLVRFIDAKMLTTVPCRQCGGHFVVHTMELSGNYICGLCHVPSRAGKTKQICVTAKVHTPALPPVIPHPLQTVLARHAAPQRRVRQAA